MAKLQQALAASGTSVSGTVEPIGLDFDGTNDYLSRSTDLVGNADSKTFTLSCWVYNANIDNISYAMVLATDVSNERFRLYISATSLQIVGRNSSNTIIFNVTAPPPPINTFSHILLSIDLANTSNRYLYVNDIDGSPSWATYTNDNINFNGCDTNYIGINKNLTSPYKGRLAHIYLDYTYRDLSIEANRRLFNQIDPDRGLIPSDTVPANPILYLPMDDPDDQGRNDGTGGNFTVNGDPSQSERGANQWNAVASEFDGSAEYLSRTTLVGISDSYTYTVSFTLRPYTDTVTYIFEFAIGTSYSWQVTRSSTSINFYSTSGSFSIPLNGLRGNLVNVSLDNRDGSLLRVFVNGQSQSISYTAENTLFPFSSMNNLFIGTRRTLADYLNGSIGDLYFDTTYIDLATDNPFWDSDTNKPKYLGEQGELPTGSQPLIYLPLRADDAGKNLGSGGDFTVNSGPLVGARGMSEYWARTAHNTHSKQTGDTWYMSLPEGSLSGITTEYTIVMSFDRSLATSSDEVLFYFKGSTGNYLKLKLQNDETLDFTTSGGDNINIPDILDKNNSSFTTTNDYNTVFISVGNTVVDVYIQGGSFYNRTSVTSSIDLSTIETFICKDTFDTGYNGRIGHFYMSDSYIDITIEDNRRLFVDALGYPVDLQQHIDSGALAEGLIRMDFSDTSDFGINKGTGGDFTVTGTATAGSDIDPNA